MNVIVSNRYAAMLSNLQTKIDLIKTINGEFEADSLVAQFDNFFFNKMILDITSVKNYQDISTIQRLSFGLDMTKIILLLDDSPVVNSDQYLSELVSMGIYNFTRNIDSVEYLINNPNTYKDVAQFHLLGNTGGISSPQSSSNNGYSNDFSDNRTVGREKNFINSSVMGAGLKGTRVIGFKNLTDHAGATTLIYMLKKQLSEHYSVLGLELDKNDFLFFSDEDLKSVSSKDLSSIINNPINNYQIILVDVNSSVDENLCSELIYLIEPSTLMIRKMVRRDKNILDKIKGKKVVLNKSLLDQNNVRKFESEAKCAIFHNIPPLDDKMDRHRILDELLNKLGFDKNRPTDNGRAAKLFGIVKE